MTGGKARWVNSPNVIIKSPYGLSGGVAMAEVVVGWWLEAAESVEARGEVRPRWLLGCGRGEGGGGET